MADKVKGFRQGDVLFVYLGPVPKETPEKAKVLKTRTVRKGENGGLHQLEKGKDVVFYEMDGNRYVISKEGVSVTHGEHHHIKLPPGHYRVQVQREVSGRDWGFVND